MVRIERAAIDSLLQTLRQSGFTVVAPTIRDGSILYDEVTSASQLPIGWTDEQGPATYKLRRREDEAMFGFAVGPHSWKKFLFPPILRLFTARRSATGFDVQADADGESALLSPYAFVGIRPCELQAIAIQDKIFAEGEYSDPHYRSMRKNLLLVSVNCTQAGGTCFCASMETGPRATDGFDLALTEVVEDSDSYFLVESGSERGTQLLNELPHRPATEEEMDQAKRMIERARTSMGRQLDTTNLKELLDENSEHPEWDKVARRCLTCANCTMVCPTCFCSTVEDVTDLTGKQAERRRRWDSCFTMEFSYIHGGSVRATARSRYRQWMTHKLSTWVDQFGTYGCVGCGRCITWCPVGIDITEEAGKIRQQQRIPASTL